MSFFDKIKQSSFYKVVVRELKRYLNSRVLPFSTLFAPGIAFYLIMSIFSSNVIRDLPVAIVDLDNTNLSRTAIRSIDASAVANTFEVESLKKAQDLMYKGKTDAIVFFSKDFEKHVLKAQSPEVTVFINNTNVIKGGTLKSGIYKSLETVSAGIKINTLIKKGKNLNEALVKAQPIKLDTHLLFNPFGNYSYFLVLALFPLIVNIFSFLVSTYAIGIELKEGTAGEWFDISKRNIITAVAGKMFPYTLLFIANVMFMNILLFNKLGTPINGSLFIILISEILLVLVYQGLAVLVIAITSNLRLSLSIGSAYTMMAVTFSGLTFPAFAMPAIASTFSLVFPYTFWLKIFLSQTLRGEPIVMTILPFICLIVYALFGLIGLFALKGRMSNSKYWGRK